MTRPLVAVLAMLSVGLPAMAHAQSARAQLEDGHAKVVGTATLSEVPGGVRVSLRMNGLKPGEHGFHIHAVGRCEPHDFMSAGPHFNPYGKHHGLANPDGPHAGDFANLEVGADGTGSLDTIDSLVTLKEGSNSLFQPGGTRAPKTGVLRATHFAIVRDCVQVINPDGVPNQIETNAVQTVSRTLKEQVTFDRSRVTSLDWASYPILTFPEIPPSTSS